jgi:hypothetical protein
MLWLTQSEQEENKHEISNHYCTAVHHWRNCLDYIFNARNDMIEAMKQALEALEKSLPRLAPYGEQDWLDSKAAITSLRQAIREHAMHEVQRLGQEIEQEPVAHQKWCASLTQLLLSMPPQPAPCNCHQPQPEQNFCPRCGKRTNDIHTCTPPMEKNT